MPSRLRLLAAALGLALAAGAPAGERGREGRHGTRAPLLPQYAQECGSCHVPYPPGLLPASAWRSLMDGLAKHFGTDASLDPEAASTIASWLAAQGGSSRRASAPPPENRITRSAWFLHEHDEIAPATWRRASVGSASNCAACHPRAEQGAFHEHDVRIPR